MSASKNIVIDYIPDSEATTRNSEFTRRRANTTIAQSTSQAISAPSKQASQLAVSTSFKDLRNEEVTNSREMSQSSKSNNSGKDKVTLTLQTDGYPSSQPINSNSSNILNEEPPSVKDAPRDEILKQIFGDVGELIIDFSCAVESTVLLHGRMYITNKYLCFYSNLFGLEKKIRIPYSHITAITKENTALVIPNAIAIRTYRKDYLFRSFWDREECFKTLRDMVSKFTCKVLPNSSPENKAPAAVVTSPSTGPTAQSLQVINSHHGHTRSQSMFVTSTGQPIMSRPLVADDVNTSPNHHIDSNSTDENEEHDETTGNLACKSEDATTDFASEITKNALKSTAISSELSINLDSFVMLFVAEGAEYSYSKYHEKVGDTNVQASPWTGDMSSNLGAGREIKFFKPVNLPGLKSTRGVKVQKCKRFSSVGLVLLSSTRLEDVPMASSFTVEDMMTVKALDNNRVLVEISFEVKFIKNLNSFFRYTIDSSTTPEMSKWLQAFYLNNFKANCKGRKKTRVKSSVENIVEESIISIKNVSAKGEILSPLFAYLKDLFSDVSVLVWVFAVISLLMGYQYIRLNSTLRRMHNEMHHTSEMLKVVLEYQKYLNSTIFETKEAVSVQGGMCTDGYVPASNSSLVDALKMLSNKVTAIEIALLKT